MNKLLIGSVLACSIAGGSYYIGYESKKPESPRGFEWSSKLQPETTLGVAYADISSLVEACPTGSWLIFKGEGRILLAGSNRYHYSLKWDPRNDIQPKPKEPGGNIYNLSVNVKKIKLTMDTDPIVDTYILDKSIFLDENKEESLLKDAMHKRLETIASNNLYTENGREALTSAIKNHIYKIYSTEQTKIGEIEVNYADGALPSLTTYDKYKFDSECARRIIHVGGTNEKYLGLPSMLEARKNPTSSIIAKKNYPINEKAGKDKVKIYRWNQVM